MKKPVAIIGILAVLAAVIAFTPLQSLIATFVRVHILETGAEEERVRLPATAAKHIRLDTWKLKKMLETPVLACELYNGGEWVVSSIDVGVISGPQKRTFRCLFARTMEHDGLFVYGDRTFLQPKETGIAVCEIGTFATPQSAVILEAVYGWKP